MWYFKSPMRCFKKWMNENYFWKLNSGFIHLQCPTCTAHLHTTVHGFKEQAKLTYFDPPNRTSTTSRLFLVKNFLSDSLISSKSLLEFKFPTNRQYPGKWEQISKVFIICVKLTLFLDHLNNQCINGYLLHLTLLSWKEEFPFCSLPSSLQVSLEPLLRKGAVQFFK